MNQPLKKGTILGSSGNLVAKPTDSVEELNLPAGVQALIEARINTGLDQLRENNRTDIKNIARDYSKKWRYVAGLATLFGFAWGLFTWFVAPDWIRSLVAQYVQNHVAEPAMKATLSEAAQKESAAYVAPLKDSVAQLRQETLSLQKEIATRQTELAENQATVRDQVKLFELSVAAKMGDGKALNELAKYASRNSPLRATAETFQKEIEQYYEAERYNLVQRNAIDTVTRQPLTLSVEEAFEAFGSPSSEGREAAANIITRLGRKSSVADLVGQLAKEEDLKVISRITYALETITKNNFTPLAKDEALRWWQQNKDKADFYFPNEAYVAAFTKPVLKNTDSGVDFSVSVDETVARDALPLFREVLQHEPAASRTRYLLIFLEIGLGKIDDAEKDLTALQEHQGDYWLLPVARAAVSVARNKNDEAIISLNGFFEKYPDRAPVVRRFSAFKPIADGANMKWPSATAQR